MKNNTTQKNIPSGWKLKKLSNVLDYERPDAYIEKKRGIVDKKVGGYLKELKY